jgi:hypothetical protein
MKERYGFTIVDLNQAGSKDDPFVVSSQVSHGLYVLDTRNKKRQVVHLSKKLVIRLKNLLDKEEFNEPNEVPP